MTRKDYETIQTSLGDALHHIRVLKRASKADHMSEAAFWYTVETISEYLEMDNKAFNSDYFKDEILRIAKIGETK